MWHFHRVLLTKLLLVTITGVIWSTIAGLQEINSLRLEEVNIPNYVVRDKSAKLECKYNLDGDELYSIKWYKDGNEFYRFVPRDLPPSQVFHLPGINVDLENSTDTSVILLSLSLQSTGRYRCEISAEAPTFQSITEVSDLTVVALPEDGPLINGAKRRYRIGETVRVNCTSGRSKPAAQLKWFINGELADSHFLHGPEIIITGREGLETAILGLEFRIRAKHFKRGDLKLKCLATIATIYWRSSEVAIEPPVGFGIGATVAADAKRKSVVFDEKSGGVGAGTYDDQLWTPQLPSYSSHAHRIQASGNCNSTKIPFNISLVITIVGNLIILLITTPGALFSAQTIR